MIRLHGIARSRNFRCIWAAEEAGVAYEIVPVGFGAEAKPELLKVNPNAKVPAMQDGDLTLFESLAINLHIAGKVGAPLLPSGDDGSRVLQWTLWAATEAEPNHSTWAYNTYIRPPEQRDPAQARAAAEALAARMTVLEAHLAADGPYLLGETFTIADCNLAAVLMGAWSNGFSFPPAVKAWLDRCFDRPAALKARKLREG